MNLTLLLIFAVLIFAAGFFFGREQMLRSLTRRMDEAYQRGRAEVEAEKQKLAGEIRDRLVDLKGSLKNTVAAYESTTRVLRSALSITAESREGNTKDLSLEFFEDSVTPPTATIPTKAMETTESIT